MDKKIRKVRGYYGFYDKSAMPKGDYKDVIIDSADSMDWLTTYEVSDMAKNHCGAVAATNISLYYDKRGYEGLKILNSKLETFKSLHSIIGNGPVMSLSKGLRKYFASRGYRLSYGNLGSLKEIKQAVDKGRIVGALLAKNLFNWHWVLIVGYREYSDGTTFVRLINGWDKTIDKFYSLHSGSIWISANEYWIS